MHVLPLSLHFPPIPTDRDPPPTGACHDVAMSHESPLLDAVDVYFRALHACDVSLLDRVFHPASTLFDVDEGVVTVDPFPAWREVVANRPSPASVGQAREEEVVAIDWLSENSASVRVRLRVLDEIFVDHLSFVLGPHGWQIVAKVWHLESTV
jgi:hypothetical protein